MIIVRVRNYRGCKYADINIDPIALVAGRNAAGKTSLAQATAATVCGEAMPVPGLTSRVDKAVLVYTGAGGAAVEVTGEAGHASMAWPAGEVISEGAPPSASHYAAGLLNLATLSPRDRAQQLSGLLQAAPTREDVAQALALADLGGPQAVEAVWSLIERHGWDGAYNQRREKGAELKGQWRQVTGQTWGAKVGASWRPDLADEGMNEPDLEHDLRAAREVHERAIAAAALSQNERDRLQQQAGIYDSKLADLRKTEAGIDALERQVNQRQAERNALPSPASNHPMPCPHCGEPVVLQQINMVERRLVKGDAPLDPAEAKRRNTAIAEADGKLAHARDELATALRLADLLRREVAEASDARERIANWPRAVETGVDIEAARAGLQRAEERLASWRRKAEADGIHGRIMGNDIVLDLLAADGLRAKKLARVVGAFNDGPLATLCHYANWSPVALDAAMAITYGGRAYALLSTSEQYRVRAVLQVAVAQIEGASMVVLDAADLLDAPSRTGLFGMLHDAGIPALVCMTISKQEQVPILHPSYGTSYWMEGGTATALGGPREAAA